MEASDLRISEARVEDPFANSWLWDAEESDEEEGWASLEDTEGRWESPLWLLREVGILASGSVTGSALTVTAP